MTIERPPIPVDDSIAPRARRRTRVVALYASYVVGCAAYAAGYHGPGLWARVTALAVITAAFFVGGAAFWFLMRRTLINAPNISDRDLDERYRERGRDATRTAYMTLSVLCALLPVYILIASTAERWAVLRDATVIADLGWGLSLVALTLPTSIMAWTEPDPIPHPG